MLLTRSVAQDLARRAAPVGDASLARRLSVASRPPAVRRQFCASKLRKFCTAPKFSQGFRSREFLEVDADGDGVLSPQEFQTWQLKRKPSVETAKAMPREFWEMSNEVLVLMAARGVEGAQRERMVREVMAVNNCLWDDAQPLVDEIKTTALSGADVYELPYYTSLVFAFFGGVVCMPLIFHLPTVEWFNARFVTSDVPQDKDLETCFEVGSWSWGWMEPVIGTLSFVLLIAQFSRAQMLNIGVRPYGKRIFDVQVARLQSRYPEYNKNILEDFLIGVKRKMKE